MGHRKKEKATMVEEEEPLLVTTQEKGGFRTLPFIIGNESLEKMATTGLTPAMTLYLMNEYHMETKTVANVLFMWSATTDFLPVIGAVIADSYLGRFHTIGFGSIIALLGMVLLWSTAIIPQTRPPPCDQSSNICSPPSTFQLLYLFVSLGLISIGIGGIRSSSMAFGADQLEKNGFSKDPGVKQSYFGWYYATTMVSVLVALTFVVYIQENFGWGVGLAVPALLMLVAVISFYLASSFYVMLESSSSLITGFVQVAVASFKNRHLKLSDSSSENLYHCKNGYYLKIPSEKLRFLNKACIVKDDSEELTPDGRAINPFTLCTVEQVEELKALLRIVPIWSSGMIMGINLCQGTFPVLQAVSMDRHITSDFEIPATSFSTFLVLAVILWVFLYDFVFLPLASRHITSDFEIPATSFSTFLVLAVILWVFLYDFVFLPLASRHMGRPVRLTTRRRMGIGIFLSFPAMIVSAMVEAIRRSLATNTEAVVRMSALWLVPQNCLTGFAETSNVIAQNEFYFSELPRSMSSVATNIAGIGASAANLLASCIMNAVDYLSRRGGQESWISSNINKGHYDYYYLVLAGLSMANLVYFRVCSVAFGPLKEEEEDKL